MRKGPVMRKRTRRIVIYYVALSIILFWICAFVWVWSQSFTGPEDHGHCHTRMYIEQDNYLIEFLYAENVVLDDIGWALLDPDGQVIEIMDDNGEIVRLEGDLTDINFSDEDYSIADTRLYDKFYSRDPSQDPLVSRNQTLYIIFLDVEMDGMFNSGDVIWIRSSLNGGIANDRIRLKFTNQRQNHIYFDSEIGTCLY